MKARKCHLGLTLLICVLLAACSGGLDDASFARSAVSDFMKANKEGNIDAAYSMLINVRAQNGELKNGKDFLREILGPGQITSQNREKMSSRVKNDAMLVERKITGVSPVTEVEASQYWVVVEESSSDIPRKIGEVRYLVVKTENGWRIDMARSDLSKALIVKGS